MLLTNQIEINVSNRTATYFKEKGYKIPTKYSENSKKEVIDTKAKILVEIMDLSDSSHEKIKYICDCCGNIFETTYHDWKNQKSPELGDLCKSCSIKNKLPKIMQNKYGYSNSAQVPEIVSKKKETNLEKYGNEWAICSKEVRDNIEQSLLFKYGVTNPMQIETVKQKAKNTNNKKYGGNSPMCSEEVRHKSEQTCLKKYGVKNAFQSKEIQRKARITLYENNTVPSSKPEKKLYNLLKDMFGEENCFPSYPEDNFSLDCMLEINNIKIDVEYDGWYWHQNRKQKDGARNAILLNNGYRIIRIIADNKDTMPTKEQIQNAVDYLVKDNHHLCFINMNI